LCFIGFDNVDVELWIDGERVVARHMVTPRRSNQESLSTDGKVRLRSGIVLIVGGRKRQEVTVVSIGRLKTIYVNPMLP
jgi:hypothetical protein